jgi:hypothetical protein
MRRLVILLLLAMASPALAEPEPQPQVTYYAKQTLLVDGLALGALLVGAAAEGPGGRDTSASNGLFAIGGIGALVGTPIVHLAHGHYGRAAGSFGMRYVAAGVGAAIAVSLAHCSDGELFCGLDALGPGIFAGLVTASVLDAFFLTDEKKPAPPGWTPQLGAGRGGLSVGVVTTF